MRPTRLIAGAAIAIGSSMAIAAAGSEGAWKAVADVPAVVVRIHWVTTPELIATARTYGKRANATPEAFSVLQQEVQSGQFVCDVYLTDRPQRLRDRATATLGHEIAHCLGYSHE